MLRLQQASRVLRCRACTLKHAPFLVVLERLDVLYMQTFAHSLVAFAGECNMLGDAGNSCGRRAANAKEEAVYEEQD